MRKNWNTKIVKADGERRNSKDRGPQAKSLGPQNHWKDFGSYSGVTLRHTDQKIKKVLLLFRQHHCEVLG